MEFGVNTGVFDCDCCMGGASFPALLHFNSLPCNFMAILLIAKVLIILEQSVSSRP